MKNTLIFISRKGRKGRRTSKQNYAVAGVVAGYARQRAQRQIVWRVAIGLMNRKLKTENGKPSTPSVATLLVPPVSGGQFAGAVLTVVTDSPPETGASTPQGGGGG